MVNADLIAAKLAELADRSARVRARCPASAAMLSADRDALEIVAFNLLLAVQLCADVANHIIADEGWPAVRTLAEGFARLAERNVIAGEIATALARAAGLRNVIAHGYAGIDPSMVYSAATAGVDDLDAFARHVAAFVAGGAGTRG